MKLANAQKELKNKFQVERFGELSMLQDATKLFKPITKGQDELLKETQGLGKQLALLNKPEVPTQDVELFNKAIENDPNPLSKDEANRINDYVKNFNLPLKQTQTNSTLNFVGDTGVNNIKIYRLGSNNYTNKTFLYNDCYLFNTETKQKELIVSLGVAKLLFEKSPSQENISGSDCVTYSNFLKKYGFTISEESKRNIIASITGVPRKTQKPQPTPLIEELPSTSGSGLRTKVSKHKPQEKFISKEKFIYLPSDPKLLYQRLFVLVGSKQSGNNNTRNEAISIMDNLLKNNHINKETYGNLLSEYNNNKK
jgi:hypothetical protein